MDVRFRRSVRVGWRKGWPAAPETPRHHETAVDGSHLAIATYGRVYVYSTSDLSEPSATLDLPWLEQRPDQIQIVSDMFGDGVDVVAYHTWLGEFVVRKLSDLTPVASFTEPGMFRFVVDGSASVLNGDPVSKPIWFSSARGHVIQVVLEKPGTGGEVTVQNASELIGEVGALIRTPGPGEPLLHFTFGGGTRLAAPDCLRSIWLRLSRWRWTSTWLCRYRAGTANNTRCRAE